MGVVKAEVTMVVYLPESQVERFKNSSIENILFEVDNGDWIGGPVNISEPVPVRRDKLHAELEAIGSDGSFFDESDVEQLVGGPKA